MNKPTTKACKWGMTNLEQWTIQTTIAQVSHSTELLDTKIKILIRGKNQKYNKTKQKPQKRGKQ